MTLHYLGAVEDIRAQIDEKDDGAFVISAVTVTITSLQDNTVVRAAEPAEFDAAGQVWFHEAFTAASEGAPGYVAGCTYLAVFTATLALSAVTYVVPNARVTFWVTAP